MTVIAALLAAEHEKRSTRIATAAGASRMSAYLLLSCPCARLAGPSGSAFLFQRLALRQLRISSSAQR